MHKKWNMCDKKYYRVTFFLQQLSISSCRNVQVSRESKFYYSQVFFGHEHSKNTPSCMCVHSTYVEGNRTLWIHKWHLKPVVPKEIRGHIPPGNPCVWRWPIELYKQHSSVSRDCGLLLKTVIFHHKPGHLTCVTSNFKFKLLLCVRAGAC